MQFAGERIVESSRYQRVDVENKCDASIPEDCRGRDSGDGAVVCFQTFDNHLTLILDCVDQQRVARTAASLDKNRDAILRLRRDIPESELSSDVDERHECVSNGHDQAISAEPVNVVFLGFQGFDDRGQRNDECLSCD